MKTEFAIILDTVSEYFEISPESIRIRIYGSRKQNIVWPRKLCHYFAWKYTKSSLVKIGEYFGELSHCAVVFSRKEVGNKYLSEKRKFDIKMLDGMIQARLPQKMGKIPEEAINDFYFPSKDATPDTLQYQQPKINQK